MALFVEDERPTPTVHSIGVVLEGLSEAELADRITVLGDEIGRLESAVAVKKASCEAAAAHFKR